MPFFFFFSSKYGQISTETRVKTSGQQMYVQRFFFQEDQ